MNLLKLAPLFIFLMFSTRASAKPLALVYDGPGSCAGAGVLGCTGAAEFAVQKAGFTVVRVGPVSLTESSTEAEYQALFSHASLWVQPGGGSKTFLTTATPALKNAIKRFVSEGGGYIGFCAGAFSSTLIDGDTAIAGLGIFPGKTEPYINETIDLFFDDVTSVLNPDALNNHIYEVNWAGITRHVYFEEGPQLLFTDADLKSVEVMATFKNGVPVSARSTFGKGRVYITGLHPEAPTGWRKNPDLNDPDGLDYDLVSNMAKWAVGQSTAEKPLAVKAAVPVVTINNGCYRGTEAYFVTTVQASGASSSQIFATTLMKVTHYDSTQDSYEVQITHTDAVTGITQQKVSSLSTKEFDLQTSGALWANCVINYGVPASGNRCKFISSNSVVEFASLPFGIYQTSSYASDGSIYTTRYQAP